MDSLQRGDTRQVFLAGGQPKCCKIVKLDKFAKAWGTCPVDPGDLILPDKVSKDFCLESKAVPSEANCTLAISSWMRHQDWYRGVKNWERYEAAYDAYIMCMVPLPDHLGVMLDERGVLEAGEPNSILRFIRENDMCAGLPDAVIKSSVLSSYEDVCPFGLPREGYTPEFDPTLTCSFHSDTHQIFLNDGASCPEGHRCACPVYSELSALKEAAEAGNEGASQVQTVIDTASATASAAVSAGLVAPVIAPAAFTLSVGAGVVGAVAFGGTYVWQTMWHSCENSIGCFPMDCVMVENVGCRIRPAELNDDRRNPFWFMPPPTYKCHLGGVSSLLGCELSKCSRSQLYSQVVGVQKSSTWLGSGTGVFNCQPLLAKDMSRTQRQTFTKMTERIKNETEEHLAQMNVVARRLENQCPWKWPTNSDHWMKCKDGTECRARITETCCQDHKGIQRCPRNFPLMCNDGLCDTFEGQCKERGGPKKCDARQRCPWLAPTLQAKMAECDDGSTCEEKAQTWAEAIYGTEKSCCAEKGGLSRCPASMPIMCADRACNGDYCCVTDVDGCNDIGGARPCPNVAVEEVPGMSDL